LNSLNYADDYCICRKKIFKVKFIKNYLRSSKSLKRLRDMIEHIDVDTIINNFVSKNARRICIV